MVANLLDIRCAEARLDGRSPRRGTFLFAGEHRFELLHPGTGEHRSRVADRDQWPGRKLRMSPLLEEAEECLADFVGCSGCSHGIDSWERKLS